MRDFFIIGLLCACAGCYPTRGRPYNGTPVELLDAAKSACQRNDQRAHDTLLNRVVQKHPGSPEASKAERILESDKTCAEWYSIGENRAPATAPTTSETSGDASTIPTDDLRN